MCGRTSLAVPPSAIESRFDVRTTDAVQEYVPKYNVDPGDGLVTVTNEASDVADVREWGFVPEWADDPDEVPSPINARAETVASSGMFRDAFENRRCLVLADGFYEWQGERGRKQPYRVCREDREPVAFAGVWSEWTPPDGGGDSGPGDSGGGDSADGLASDGGARQTVAILTTEANAVLAPIHDRMPVVLEPGEEPAWLAGSADEAAAALDPYPEADLEAYPVSTAVNDPDSEGAGLFDEVEVGDQTGLDDFAA